jgi:hypothetical protein
MSIANWVAHGAAHGSNEALKPVWDAVGKLVNFATPNALPKFEEAVHLGLGGWIPLEVVEACARADGHAMNLVGGPAAVGPGSSFFPLTAIWNAAYNAQQERPPVSEYLEIANRQLLPPAAVQAELATRGMVNKDFQQWVQNLQFDIPGPSDLVRFSVRHLWEPELMAALGYEAEFPGTIIDIWHAMKGLDYGLFTGPFREQINTAYGDPAAADALLANYLATVGVEPTWARAYWWSHWVLPSPTQGLMAWFRLASGRNTQWDGPEAEGVDFDYTDLELLLRANDYPPKYRSILAAIGRPVPGIRYARDFYRTGVYTVQNLYEWGLRQGYSHGDATDIAVDIQQSVDAAKDKPAQCRQCALVERAYRTGVISYDQLGHYYLQFGLEPAVAQQRADAVTLELSVDRAKQLIATVRSRFLSGELNLAQAQNLLLQYGVVAARVTQYLTDWSLEKSTRRKQLTAAQAVKWACQGLITLPDLEARLANLGYAPDDVLNLSAEAVLCQTQMQLRAAQKAEAAREKTIRQAAAAQKAAAQALMQARRQLASHGSPSMLRRWFCEGLVGEAEVLQRLNYLGWPTIDSLRLIGDCKSGTPGSQPGTSGGNPGGP